MQPEFAPQIAPRVAGEDRLFDGIDVTTAEGEVGAAPEARCSARTSIAPATRPRPPEDLRSNSSVGDTLSYVTGTRDATRHDDGVDTTG